LFRLKINNDDNNTLHFQTLMVKSMLDIWSLDITSSKCWLGHIQKPK